MGHRQKSDTRNRTTEQAMRDQEVLRANGELVAYFNGDRTEREARAALKIIKAFVRDRERRGARHRLPLPAEATAPKKVASGKDLPTRERRARHPRLASPGKLPTRRTPRTESELSVEPPQSSVPPHVKREQE
jgi:hypothetical protein